jgi:hypothetical protein
MLLALTNNVVETFNASLKVQVTLNTKPEIFFKQTIQQICHMVSTSHYSHPFFSIPFEGQIESLTSYVMPDDIISEAAEYITTAESTFFITPENIMYINVSTRDQASVTQKRIDDYEDAMNGRCSVDVSTQTWNDLKYMTSSLYRVKAIYNDRQQLLRCVCTCKTYLCSTFRCSHLLVMLDVLQKYSISQMCTNMTASNKNKIIESSDKSNTLSVSIVAEDGVARYGVADLSKRRFNKILVLFNSTDKDGNLVLLPEYVDSKIVSAGNASYNSKRKEINIQRIS